MIGEIFRSDYLDSMMMTLETDKIEDCTGCDYFLHGGCTMTMFEEHGYCSSDFRTDKKNVIFKETGEQAFMKIINLLYLKK